jgi:hypothetical protein
MWQRPEFAKDTDSPEVAICERSPEAVAASPVLARYEDAFGTFQGAKALRFTDDRELLFVRFERAYVVVIERPGREGAPPDRTQLQLTRESMHALYLLYWLTAVDEELFERDAQLLEEHLDAETKRKIEHAFLGLADAIQYDGEHGAREAQAAGETGYVS